MPDMTDYLVLSLWSSVARPDSFEDGLIDMSKLISDIKDMDEKEAWDLQAQITYWKAFRLAYSKLKSSQRDQVQSIIAEEDK
jgi:hypothetical protein